MSIDFILYSKFNLQLNISFKFLNYVLLKLSLEVPSIMGHRKYNCNMYDICKTYIYAYLDQNMHIANTRHLDTATFYIQNQKNQIVSIANCDLSFIKRQSMRNRYSILCMELLNPKILKLLYIYR